MSSLFIVVSIGLLGGVAAALQGSLSGLMGKELGVLGSIFIIHLGGTLASGLLFLWPGAGSLAGWREVPWYALAGGLLGLVLVGALGFCVPRIGAGATFSLIIGSQLLVGVCLDHFGVLVAATRSIDASRGLGVLVLFFGVWLVVR